MMAKNILVVDDEPSMCRYLRTLLEADAYRVETAGNGIEALERIERGPLPDLVLLDVRMPEVDGLETLMRMRRRRPKLNVVMMSCVTETRRVVEAMRLGARDYLTKPFQKSELDAVLQNPWNGVEGNPLGAASSAPPETEAVAPEAEDLGDDLWFVAAGPAMHRIRAQAAQIADIDVPVLILGESGTGKEIVARLIHKLSERRGRSFLKVNCAALPGDLLESELFGYEAGAFTGAIRPKPGKFELCDRGTMLLDEIGEIPTMLQAKLLHVLQDGQFARLGSRSSVKVDVRILAATNVDVQAAMAAGKLREDLYYRLNAFTLELPPLRERRDEIPLLLRHFMARFSARYGRAPLPLSTKLIEACRNHSWPGNLRELENFVKRYAVMGDEALVLPDLQANPSRPALRDERADQGDTLKNASRAGDLKSLVRGLKEEAEMQAIAQALEQANGVRKEAARLLSISTKALLYKMRQFGLDRP